MASNGPGQNNTSQGCLGCVGLIGVMLFFGFIVSTCSGTTSSSSSNTTASVAASPAASPDETDPPAPTPEPIAQQKKEFLDSVDESISGPMIAGAPYKYVGDAVDLHCTVENVPDQSFFNAACGQDEDGLPATIVVKSDSAGDLAKGQSVRVIGTVAEPMEGTNAMGGDMKFPTVEARFME